jgi:uncharacterized membrane protein YphA (DoxX/SURF4 family)
MTIELGKRDNMDGALEWIAAIGTMVAAALVAADLGRRVTGFGFVLFCAVAITWVISGLTSDAMPIAAMNGVLLLINAYGVWQYLLSPKNRTVMDRLEPVAERIEKQVEAEEAT